MFVNTCALYIYVLVCGCFPCRVECDFGVTCCCRVSKVLVCRAAMLMGWWCLGMQLSLTMELWDHVSRKWKTIPDAHHIHRVLSMKKEHRILLWRMLCPGVCWEKVQMGGQSLGPKCRVEDDDFATLCATGSMEGVKHLLLHCMDRVTDQCFLSLAQAGCGTQLTSLFLSGE